MISKPIRLTILALLVVALPAGLVHAKGFPEITDAEREMTSVPGEPNAPAVILFLDGEMSIMDPDRSLMSSVLEVQARIKILNDQGLEYAERNILHGADDRLLNLEAQTVLPDGTVVPVPEDSIFRKEYSRSEKLYITSIAFPRVEPGAILEYRYEIRFERYLIGPWLFQSDIPTLHSEVVYNIPSYLGMQPWGRATFGRKMNNDGNRTPRGFTFKVWMDGLPAIPDEPYRYPDFDLSSVFNITATEEKRSRQPIFSDWENTCSLYEDWYYHDARKRAKHAKNKAKELTAEAAGPREAAEAIYRYVRDEVGTKRIDGVTLVEDSTVDGVLEAREGDYAEKALMLQTMLEAVGLDAQLVWIRDRDTGLADLRFVNPHWFDEAIVRVEIDGEQVYLDPSDRRLGFGARSASYEGTAALVEDPKSPDQIRIPDAPFEQNVRAAEVALTVDDEGRVSGEGTLTLEGHHAQSRIDWKGTPEETAKAWEKWLEADYPGYDVSGIEVSEERENGRVTVRWTLEQLEEEVLGDEVTVNLSRPLGPVEQPFTLAVAGRRTPVLLSFPDRNQLHVKVGWPEGWAIDVRPEPVKLSNGAGELEVSVAGDPAARSLELERRFDTHKRDFQIGTAYKELRDLYAAVEKSDAQTLVLVHR